jgi:phosphoserine phosphatase RsbU/P
MLEPALYDVKSVQLQPGDKIVLFSDGLSEAENAEGQFFDRSLRVLLETHSSAGSTELHRRLIEAVKEFTEDADPGDDITTLVLEYRP